MRATVASVLLLSACVDVASASHLCTSLVPRLMSTVRCHNDAKCMRHIGVQLCGGVATCTAAGFCDWSAEPAPTCDEIKADFTSYLATIQTCDTASECGTVLTGTSCGCTRNLVARADLTAQQVADFEALKAQYSACGGSFLSTCDCPAASGFKCSENRCSFNLVTAPVPVPVPEPTCAEITADYTAFLARIQTCSAAGDCGTVLSGTGCGCTRNKVARADLSATDLATFNTLLGQYQTCNGPLITICDCPASDGFRCTDAGMCAHNLVTAPVPVPVPEPTCAEITADYNAFLTRIQTCSAAGDCGTVLSGTGCGCTRNLVARADLSATDLAAFNTLLGQYQTCNGPLITICDCPASDGFRCTDAGVCAHNLVTAPVPVPVPEPTCDEITADYTAFLARIQTCSAAGDCGTVLSGTGCGCTRNLVARADLSATDLAAFNTLLGQYQTCNGPLITICDCPVSDGFRCTDAGVCAHNLVTAPVPVPVPEPTCDEITADYTAFLARIQTCSTAGDCGTVLSGTGCGCTRNKVARADLSATDLATFNTLLGQYQTCNGPLITICDCPASDGFRCTDAGMCAHNLVGTQPAPIVDVCSTAEAEYEAALTTVQTCRESAECEPARPLVGTSCGCTRNLLASVRATDAEMAAFSAKKDVLVECFGSSRFISTCDCPARVPQCVAGRCAYSAALA